MRIADRESTLEERITRLELRVGEGIEALEERADGLDARLRSIEVRPFGWPEAATARTSAVEPAWRAAGSSASRCDPRRAPKERSSPGRHRPARRPPGASLPVLDDRTVARVAFGASPAGGPSLGDVVGGRVLAWIGATATLLGIVLFLSLAIAHGWIGEEARVAFGGLASAALMAAGVWLHDHRGHTEAARAMVGAATVGLFATLIVASEIYELIPALVSVCASMMVGALATVLAIRWAGRVIGALGLVGALLSPILVGAQPDLATIATLAIAGGWAMFVAVRQDWGWMGLATVLVCAPQWGGWVLEGQPAAVGIVVLVAFGALGLAGPIAAQLHRPGQRPQLSWVLLVAINALLGAAIGYFTLRGAGGTAAGELWLAALAAVNVAVGLWPERRAAISQPMRQLLIAIGVILADVAFALGAEGLVLVFGWGATAIGFAWLARRAAPDGSDRSLLGLGVGAHLALVLTRALLDAPPGDLGAGDAQLVPLLSVSVLAASSMGCARITDPTLRAWRVTLDSLGLLALAYLTATALDDTALVTAWAFEALALAQIARRTRDHVARYGSLAFLSGAALLTLAVEAPPDALLTGVSDLAAAAVALGVLAAATVRAAWAHPTRSTQRRVLLGGAGASLLYLASMAIISAFQPGSSETIDTVLDLSMRQQGQVLLSALWSLVGLTGLIIGLRARLSALRTAALTLLLITVAKVFLYDLSTLTSIYRVISFTVLGVLLLAGAFAYQRLRPPPPPDMRTLHPSQR